MQKILVIDDDVSITSNLKVILQMDNFDVITANDGKSGVDLALEHRPDLIICDINMPKMNGLEVLRVLRTEPLTFNIPFLFLTVKSNKEELRKGMEEGADDFLTKPYTNEEIIKAVEIRLQKVKENQKYYESKLQDLRDNIALSLPDELSNQLNNILGFSKMLSSNSKYMSKEDIKMMADSITISAEQMEQLIRNYLTFTNLKNLLASEYSMPSLRVFDPDAMIIMNANAVSDKYNRRSDLDLQLTETTIYISEEHLNKILEELLDNAFKFSFPETPVIFKSEVNENDYIISVENQGSGLSSDQISKIGEFMQFDRTEQEQTGVGLGLAIVKLITKLYKGEMVVKSVPGETTTVKIILKDCIYREDEE
jgi:two-component system sensor histidine kinase/response regulator